jgi:2-succinyl-5-enolpyruvyl-6-hydroxy-3-cyclohexene-1-carboxylate synthase
MSFPNPSTALAATVIDELVRGGVGLVVAAPGSRSTALVLAVAARADLQMVVAIDERSAGFHALGWAKATGRPAAVLTTSGTAVANLMPSVVEADAAGVALVVLSANRPPEMRGVGANQTIDQPGLFGTFVRGTVVLGPAEHEPSAPRWWRSMISQALAAATGWNGRPGPVQVDIAFREPTVGVTDDGRTAAEPYRFTQVGRRDARQWTETATRGHPTVEVIDRIGEAVAHSTRGLILAGTGSTPAVAELGVHLGWPVVATAESGLRRMAGVVTAGHHLLASEVAHPDMVLRFGGPGPSRRLIDLVSGDIHQVVVGDSWSDPGRMADLLVDADPEVLAGALTESVPAAEAGVWHAWWSAAEAAVRGALEPELQGLSEPAVAFQTARLATDRLVVASSMPIRDVEGYAFEAPPLIANRGASGIDGIVSTALGAATGTGPGVALIGDLSLLHDSNGFLISPRSECVFVVIDNSGGGIFSFLPQAEHVGDDFERLFATPPDRDLAVLADFHGLDYRVVGRGEELAEAVVESQNSGGCSLVVVRTDRNANVAEHRRLERVASTALGNLSAP